MKYYFVYYKLHILNAMNYKLILIKKIKACVYLKRNSNQLIQIY